MDAGLTFSFVQRQLLFVGLIDDRQFGRIVLFLPDKRRVDSCADAVGKYQCVGISANLAIG